MSKNPKRWIVRIVLDQDDYAAFKAAAREERLYLSAFGRQLLLKALRRRSRDKTLQNPLTDPTTTDGK